MFWFSSFNLAHYARLAWINMTTKDRNKKSEMFSIEWLHRMMTCLSDYLKEVQQYIIDLSLFNAQVNLSVDFGALKW